MGKSYKKTWSEKRTKDKVKADYRRNNNKKTQQQLNEGEDGARGATKRKQMTPEGHLGGS